MAPPDLEYKFDVAFSFLARDEAIARELSDILQARGLRTFVYSEQQLEVAGTEGIEAFTRVFRNDARLVVVLFRPGWGESKWTRIEETAIKNRGLNHGFKFAPFVVLESNAKLPDWYPETYIWIDREAYGSAGAAAVIEARARELGGQVHEETPEDRAARISRARGVEQERNRFLRSDEGNASAQASFGLVSAEFQRRVPGIKERGVELMFKDGGSKSIALVGLSMSATVNLLGLRYGNSAEDAVVEVKIWDGHPYLPGLSLPREPKQRERRTFAFDLASDGPRWRADDKGTSRFYSPEELAGSTLTLLLQHIERDDERRRKSSQRSS